MSDDISPWPESERTQRLLFAVGVLLLVPVAVGLADFADVGGAVVVLSATLASALLVYGLLGWAGTWVEADRPGDAPPPATDGAAGDDDEEPAGVEEDEDTDAGTGDAQTDADTGDAQTDADTGDSDTGNAGAGSDTEGTAGDRSWPDA